MTLTVIPPDEAIVRAMARDSFLDGIHALEAWFRANPSARVPDVTLMSVDVPGATREQRLAALREIASSWGVPVVEHSPGGTMSATLRFGAVGIEAHIPSGDGAGDRARPDWARNRRPRPPRPQLGGAA